MQILEGVVNTVSEELIQRDLVAAPEHIGQWEYYNIGATTLKSLKAAKIIPQKDYAEFEMAAIEHSVKLTVRMIQEL